MQVFVNISWRGCFYSEELCPSAFTGWLELWWAPFLLCSQLLPGTGSIQILSYTLQRWSLVPIRDQSLVAHPRCMLVHTFFVWGPIVIQANHCSFPRPCIPTLLRLQLRFATLAGLHFGSCRPRHTCLFDKELPPPVWLRTMVTPASASTPVVAAIHHRRPGPWNH
jgi:hypothetical protein